MARDDEPLAGALGAFSGWASEVGRELAGRAHDAASTAVGGAARTFNHVRLGPVIPAPYDFGASLRTNGLVLQSVLRSLWVLQRHGVQPVAVGLAGVQLAACANPDGYRLWAVGLNGYRVIERHEWRRLVTAPLVAPTLPLVASCVASTLGDVSEIERRAGPAAAATVVFAAAVLQQGLHLAVQRLAAQFFPSSQLATLYRGGYTAGMDGILSSIKVVASYLRQARVQHVALPQGLGATASDVYTLTEGCLSCWLHVGINACLGGSVAAGIAGNVAGLAVVYGAASTRRLVGRLLRLLLGQQAVQGGVFQGHGAALGWEGVLGWHDLAAHAMIGGLMVGLLVLGRRQGGVPS